MSAPENPRAFPNPGYNQEGMTLRDYFAGQALAGLCANYQWLNNVNKAKPGRTAITAACSAYEFADALLATRSGSSDRG